MRYYRNDRNLGQVKNFSLGLSKATGEFVGLLADDDLIEPTFIEDLVRPLLDHPDVVVAFCDYWIIDETDRVNAVQTKRVRRYFGMHVIPEGYHADCEVLALQYRAISIVSGSLLRRSAADWASIPDMLIRCDVYHLYLAARTRKGCYYVRKQLTRISQSINTISMRHTDLNGKITIYRESLYYWSLFQQDKTLSNRRYYHLKRAHSAALLTFYLACAGRWRESAAEIWKGLRVGLFKPASVLEHISYFFSLRWAGLRRKLP